MPRIHHADRVEVTIGGHRVPADGFTYVECAPEAAADPPAPPEGMYANTFTAEASVTMTSSSFNEFIETMSRLQGEAVFQPPPVAVVPPHIAARLRELDEARPGAPRLGDIDLVVDPNLPADRAYMVPADLARFGYTPPRLEHGELEHFMTEAGRNAGSYAESALHSAIRDAAIVRAGDQLRDTLRRQLLERPGSFEAEPPTYGVSMPMMPVPSNEVPYNFMRFGGTERRWAEILEEVHRNLPRRVQMAGVRIFCDQQGGEFEIVLRAAGRIFAQTVSGDMLAARLDDEERYQIIRDILLRMARDAGCVEPTPSELDVAGTDVLDRFAEALGLRRLSSEAQTVYGSVSGRALGRTAARLESDDELRARCRHAMTRRVEPQAHEINPMNPPPWVRRIQRPTDCAILVSSFEIVIDALAA